MDARVGIFKSLQILFEYKRLPEVPLACMRFDRTLEFDFSHQHDMGERAVGLTNSYRNQYERYGIDLLSQASSELIDRVDSLVRQIQRRDGEVVFVRMPSSGDRLAMENDFHPRESYWENLASRIGGVWIHFEDLAEIITVRCPDNSHLDYRDAPRFTAALVRELVSRGVVETN